MFQHPRSQRRTVQDKRTMRMATTEDYWNRLTGDEIIGVESRKQRWVMKKGRQSLQVLFHGVY